MKKKLLLAGVVALIAAAAVTGYTAHSKTGMVDLLSANVEALARGEKGDGYKNARAQYCAIPQGEEGCFDSPLRHCDLNVFCIR